MIGLWVLWNAMDSQTELQQTSGEKERQLVKNSWNNILITCKMNWKMLPHVKFGTTLRQIWETILVRENMSWNEEQSILRGEWTQAKPHFQWCFAEMLKVKLYPHMLLVNQYTYILNGLQQVHQEQGITDQRVDGLMKPSLQIGFSHWCFRFFINKKETKFWLVITCRYTWVICNWCML